MCILFVFWLHFYWVIYMNNFTNLDIQNKIPKSTEHKNRFKKKGDKNAKK